MRRALALLALVACKAEPPRPAPAPFLEAPTEFIRDVDESERLAFEIKAVMQKKICGGLSAGSSARALEHAVPAVAARWVGPERARPDLGEKVSGFEAERADPVLDRAAIGAKLDALLDAYARIERCVFKPYEVFTKPSKDAAFLRYHLELEGRDPAGRGLAHRGEGAARFVTTAGSDAWKLERLDLDRLEREVYAGPVFADVSGLAGIGLSRSPEKQAAILRDLGNIAITNLGGLHALDWNEDGFVDLLAYNRESLFLLFLNDGKGGFVRAPEAGLIPHAEAALFYLSLDLDGDGHEEVVGTRPDRCVEGFAEIPILRRVKGRLVDTKKRIRYRASPGCRDRFVHIAADDLDGDGRLDLFFSNYGDSADRSRHNLVDATDGGKNYLFMNEGGLDFADESEARGLDAETRNTYLGHWFDVNGDGRRDLIEVNDFAKNKIYLANAEGRLVRTEMSPLTDNGFSMGITTADLDNDGDFDIHISNMFSYAGHRILAVSPEVSGAKRDMLLAMARGNTVYRNEGGGRYTEVAASLGLNRARWAWGNLAFDYDNDGDRDVYVVNGYNSNPDDPGGAAPDN